ncbi:hypothetical protein [Pseudoalteromonas rubra]|uniref:hypothetical protein n=1 Tax=Pseudoalteromonas rubra TaxID=43658 RepID=UPI000F787E46|nr:hypothetical protein [Pseudoalteromonas rubra]
MQYHVLLTLDLPGATSSDREKFYEYLSTKLWAKIDNLTTAWRCSFNEGVPVFNAIEECKQDLSAAANHAGITRYNAAIHAGQSAPTII